MRDHKDVIACAMQMDEWTFAAYLSTIPFEQRPSVITDLLLLTANSPQGQNRLYESRWKLLDKQIEKQGQLLFAAIMDVQILPLLKKTGVWQEKQVAAKHALILQAEQAINILTLLPKDGAGFEREIDQADIRLHEINVKIYTDTRALFFGKIAEAWAKVESDEVAGTFFGFLIEHAPSSYGDLVTAAVRAFDEQASTKRVETAMLQLEKTAGQSNSRFSRARDLLSSLSLRWIKSIGHERVLRYARLNQVVTVRLSPASEQVLLQQASLIERMEETAQAFFRHWHVMSDGWTITNLDLKSLEIVVAKKVDGRFGHRQVAAERTIATLQERLAGWTSPHPEMSLVAELYKDTKEVEMLDRQGTKGQPQTT